VKALAASIALVLTAACNVPEASTPDADPHLSELRGVWITRFAFTSQADL
jgi:hypothetical protein